MFGLVRWGAALAAVALGAFALPGQAEAAPQGPSGPVIHHAGNWYIRTTPSGGAANVQFHYGLASDLPLTGDWNGNGKESVGVARFTDAGPIQWFLRNSNSAGPADTTFTFGHHTSYADDLTSFPVAGNFDGADAASEVGVVYGDPKTGALEWQIRKDLTPDSPVYTFTYGRLGDRPIVGDWNGDGVDTAGVVRGANQWLLTNKPLTGGAGDVPAFTFGSGNPRVRDLPVVGDWNGDGTDTPGVLRDNPPTETYGGYENWLVRNSNSAGPVDSSFTFGSDALSIDFPVEYLTRLTIKVG